MPEKTLFEKVVDIYNKEHITDDDIKQFYELTAMSNCEAPVENVKFTLHPPIL